MYELIQVSQRDYYIQSPARIGLVQLDDTRVCLIDSGNDKDAGKKVRRILEANGWELACIFNTHYHADHVGGNRYLQEQTGCAVYAPELEDAFVAHPILEPALLYGGCPPGDLRHKFLMAQESRPQPLTADVLPEGWELLDLPGHSFRMAGFRTPEGTVYLGDCLSGRETLEKYGIGVVYDVAAYLDTLERVAALEGRMFVPAHTEATRDIAPLANFNAEQVHRVAEQILALCGQPICFEALLQKLFDAYGLTMNFEQYVLVGSTVRSYLSWLKDSGRVTVAFSDNLLLWQRA